MKRVQSALAWLDNRTGYKRLLHEGLYENVPGGSRWRYVWGSTLSFAFMVQVITGIFLWMAYSPSSQTAWESVFYIQNEMWGGWLLRGIHHFTAQAMTVLLVLHLMQVLIDGAYKAPREINFWLGLVLLMLVLGLSLTGYLLPWDQKGFWATKVATSIMAITPVIGSELQRVVVGGSDYGHHTLTRFFALHAGVLPGLVIFFIVGHIYLFRKHGLTAKEPKTKPDCAFWPDQVLKDAVACLAVLGAILFLILKPRLFGHGELGADLGAPADPSEQYPARPEWYFLFLFQFLKLKAFQGEREIIGAIIIPGIVMAVLFAMPFIGKWRLGHRFNIGFISVILGGAALLTFQSFQEDQHKPEYRAAVVQAERDSLRVRQLAREKGIPLTGAVSLLHDDPLTQGPKLFAKNCASCHRYDGHNALGSVPKDPQSASDLKGFGTREWIAGLMNPQKIVSTNYFGGTKFADGKMAKFVKKDGATFTQEQVKQIADALSAEAQLPAQADAGTQDTALIEQGRAFMATETARCTECHQFRKKDEDATAPDLTGYASREWLIAVISNPKHERFYGKRNDRMPSFGEDKILDARSIGLIADWLRDGTREVKLAHP
ncbi:MAG TPA: cytochrome b N-terminal domain-containing protein [Verrucomicrobiae bacterium]|jgi:ubiquinol-cytochrome c reductase cytochrome b subunit